MWRLNHDFFRNGPITVAVVGVGGTGSELVSNLTRVHRALLAHDKPGLHVVAFDPDVVSPANIVRQRYHESDLGRNKADVLIERVNAACAYGWESVPDRFEGPYARRAWDLVISAVDSRTSRKKLHRFAFENRFGHWKLWVDTGNDRHTGQVVLGTPRPPKRALEHGLPCVTELHPELMDTTIKDQNTPSCSAIDAITKQDLMVNTMTAALATDLLWNLFKNGETDTHAVYFNLRPYRVSSRAVPTKPKRSAKPAAEPIAPKAVARKTTRAGRAA